MCSIAAFPGCWGASRARCAQRASGSLLRCAAKRCQTFSIRRQSFDMTYASAVRSYAESFALFCKSRAKAPKTRREQKTTLFCARASAAVLGGLTPGFYSSRRAAAIHACSQSSTVAQVRARPSCAATRPLHRPHRGRPCWKTARQSAANFRPPYASDGLG